MEVHSEISWAAILKTPSIFSHLRLGRPEKPVQRNPSLILGELINSRCGISSLIEQSRERSLSVYILHQTVSIVFVLHC